MPIKATFVPVGVGPVPGAPVAGAVAAITPGMIVGALLLACCVKGFLVTAGVEVPPDPDTVRDLGFIQGFIDGNWFGDPAIAGGWRWYPPLLHGLAALVIGGLGLSLLPTWLHAGVLLNLLSPLTFYLMNRRLIGPWPAVAATTVFVLFDSVVMPSDAAAGYTPWTLTPALAWPLFFGSVWLIASRLARLRLADAALIGTALGLVFLAHTVPAVLLSGITVSAAVAAHGLRPRVLLWLGVVGGTELLWSAPFLLPLIRAYHLHIANPGPGAWVHPALTDPATLLPNVLGCLVALWLMSRREWSRLPRISVAILGAWVVLCAGFLGRHYACAAMAQSGGACGVFVIAAHHYHVYLQAAWATLAGVALVRLWSFGRRQDLVPLGILAVLLGMAGFFAKAEDTELHRMGSARADRIMDRAAYDWILSNTRPADLFVTELPPQGADMGPAAATVMAAGRRLVAPPEFHTNPYVEWAAMNARRLAYLDGDFCSLLQQAGGDSAFLLLRNDRLGGAVTPVFSSTFHTVYRVDDSACSERYQAIRRTPQIPPPAP